MHKLKIFSRFGPCARRQNVSGNFTDTTKHDNYKLTKNKKMKEFFKKLFGKSGDEIDNYQYKGAEDIILTCSALRGYRRHSDAIRLYEKFDQQIIDSDYEVVGLTTILKICQENFDTPRMVNYAKRLKVLAPDHPWVIELSKYHTL